MKLHYDEQGFIKGIKRLEEQTSLVHEDTGEILKILQNWQQTSQANAKTNHTLNVQKLAQAKAQAKVQAKQAGNAIKVAKTEQAKVVAKAQAGTSAKTTKVQTTKAQTSTSSQDKIQKTKLVEKTTAKTRQTAVRADKVDKPQKSPEAVRDEKGRFTKKAEENTFIKKLGETIGKNTSGASGVNTDQIDPLVDGAKELAGLATPMTRMLSVMGGGVITVAKQYRIKRREPLSIHEERHHRKLLDALGKIDNNTRSSLLGKLLGGLMGLLSGLGGLLAGAGLDLPDRRKKPPKSPSKNPQLPPIVPTGTPDNKDKPNNKPDDKPDDKPKKESWLKKGLKFAGKGLGAVGAALGVGMLASQWGDMTGEDKTAGVGGLLGSAGGGWGGAVAGAAAGGAIGSVVPVVGTAIGAGVGGVVGAVAGGVAGSTAGEYLGRKAFPHMKEFGVQMTGYGLPERMQSGFLGGLSPLFTAIPQLVRTMTYGIKSMMGRAAQMLGGLGGTPVNGGYTPHNFSDVQKTQDGTAKGKELGFQTYVKPDAFAGGVTKSDTIGFAKVLDDDGLGGNMARFSAFNDGYHARKSPNSKHTKGVKFDLVLKDGSVQSYQQAKQRIEELAKQNGYIVNVTAEHREAASRGIPGFAWYEHSTGAHLDVEVVGRTATPNQATTSNLGSTTGGTTGNWGSAKAINKGSAKNNEVHYTQANGSVVVKKGGTAAWRNNNPGNLKVGVGNVKLARQHGAIGIDAGGFAIFKSREDGLRAQVGLLKGKAYRSLTVAQAITKYAPPNENNTAAYIQFVAQQAGVSTSAKLSSLTDQQFNALVQAMHIKEGDKAGQIYAIGATGVPLQATTPQQPSTINPTTTNKINKKVTALPGSKTTAPASVSVQQNTKSSVYQGAAMNRVVAINQNISDGRLAHSTTGGIGTNGGMRR